MKDRIGIWDWLLAIGCAAWMAAFHLPVGWRLATLSVLVVPALVLLRWSTSAAAIGLVGVVALFHVVAGTTHSPGFLAPVLVCGFGLGRYGSLWLGAGWLAALSIAATVPPGVVAPAIAVVMICASIGFGWLVRRRTASARTAEQILADQAALRPHDVAAEVVAAERSRLAHETVGAVRDAVADMREAAVTARASLDGGALSSIQARGRAAIADLFRLLGLLRSEPSRPAPASTVKRSVWRVDALIAVLVAVVGVVENWNQGLVAVVLTVVAAASLALRREDPAIACVVAAGVSVLAIGLGTGSLRGLWSGVLVLLLAWEVAAGSARGASRLGWPALVLLTIVRLVEVSQGPRSDVVLHMAIEVALVALGAVAAYLWAERERVERAALAEASRLRDATSEVVDAAVREERLRVARELHDVTSNAVAVMVVQAGAAIALAGRDRAAAGRAINEIEQAGSRVLAELDMLARLLARPDTPVAGPAGTSDGVPDGLDALVERMRGAGLRITQDLAGLPLLHPEADRTVYRVVQEGLTNVVRHAPGSEVTVGATAVAGVLEVRVHNELGATTTPEAERSGFGLVGLAERLRSVGGSLQAGPNGTGFTLLARIPLQDPAP